MLQSPLKFSTFDIFLSLLRAWCMRLIKRDHKHCHSVSTDSSSVLRMFEIHGYGLKYFILYVQMKYYAHTAVIDTRLYVADEILCQNTRMPLYDWRHCNIQATNLVYYALLSSLNPLSVFDFLMNLRSLVWQVARQSDWKAVILYSSILSQLLSAKQTWGLHSLVEDCDSCTTYKVIMLSPKLHSAAKNIGFMH